MRQRWGLIVLAGAVGAGAWLALVPTGDPDAQIDPTFWWAMLAMAVLAGVVAGDEQAMTGRGEAA